MDFPNLVWSEREAGDWEACVTASYSMALLYGGVPMAAPYTQPQRELLERVKDEPQDLNTTDAMSLAVYGHKLRPISAPTIQATVKRRGVGVCLTGFGCPGTKWQAGHFQHEVFYLPTTETSGLLGDPMAPHGAKPELVPSSTMVAWAKGVAPNDGREVTEGEFSMDSSFVALVNRKANCNPGTEVHLAPTFSSPIIYKAPAAFVISPVVGNVQGEKAGGSTDWCVYWNPPHNRWEYVHTFSWVTALVPIEAGGFTQADINKAVVTATAPLKAENATLTNKLAEGQQAAQATVTVLA